MTDIINPGSKVHGSNMRPIWVLSAPDGPHVGPMNFGIREYLLWFDNTLHFKTRANSQQALAMYKSNTGWFTDVFKSLSLSIDRHWLERQGSCHGRWRQFCTTGPFGRVTQLSPLDFPHKVTVKWTVLWLLFRIHCRTSSRVAGNLRRPDATWRHFSE